MTHKIGSNDAYANPVFHSGNLSKRDKANLKKLQKLSQKHQAHEYIQSAYAPFIAARRHASRPLHHAPASETPPHLPAHIPIQQKIAPANRFRNQYQESNLLQMERTIPRHVPQQPEDNNTIKARSKQKKAKKDHTKQNKRFSSRRLPSMQQVEERIAANYINQRIYTPEASKPTDDSFGSAIELFAPTIQQPITAPSTTQVFNPADDIETQDLLKGQQLSSTNNHHASTLDTSELDHQRKLLFDSIYNNGMQLADALAHQETSREQSKQIVAELSKLKQHMENASTSDNSSFDTSTLMSLFEKHKGMQTATNMLDTINSYIVNKNHFQTIHALHEEADNLDTELNLEIPTTIGSLANTLQDIFQIKVDICHKTQLNIALQKRQLTQDVLQAHLILTNNIMFNKPLQRQKVLQLMGTVEKEEKRLDQNQLSNDRFYTLSRSAIELLNYLQNPNSPSLDVLPAWFHNLSNDMTSKEQIKQKMETQIKSMIQEACSHILHTAAAPPASTQEEMDLCRTSCNELLSQIHISEHLLQKLQEHRK